MKCRGCAKTTRDRDKIFAINSMHRVMVLARRCVSVYTCRIHVRARVARKKTEIYWAFGWWLFVIEPASSLRERSPRCCGPGRCFVFGNPSSRRAPRWTASARGRIWGSWARRAGISAYLAAASRTSLTPRSGGLILRANARGELNPSRNGSILCEYSSRYREIHGFPVEGRKVGNRASSCELSKVFWSDGLSTGKCVGFIKRVSPKYKFSHGWNFIAIFRLHVAVVRFKASNSISAKHAL